jgi:hypothetical protein
MSTFLVLVFTAIPAFSFRSPRSMLFALLFTGPGSYTLGSTLSDNAATIKGRHDVEPDSDTPAPNAYSLRQPTGKAASIKGRPDVSHETDGPSPAAYTLPSTMSGSAASLKGYNENLSSDDASPGMWSWRQRPSLCLSSIFFLSFSSPLIFLSLVC